MQVEFEDLDLQEYAETGQSKKFKKYVQDKKFTTSLIRVLTTMKSVADVSKLKEYSWLHYEKLKYSDNSSVRIMNGRVERLIFEEREEGINVLIIEIDDTHYGKKK